MPRIAAVEPVKRRPNERRVVLEDGDEYAVLAESLVVLGVTAGDVLTDARMTELLDQDMSLRARTLAWALVAAAPRTRKQVEDALMRKKLPRRAIDEAIGTLARGGYLDEKSYADGVVETKGRGAGQGPLLVEARLEASGVSRKVRDEAVHSLRADQRALARQALKKWMATHPKGTPTERARKAADHLARRGFESEVVWEVVEQTILAGMEPG